MRWNHDEGTKVNVFRDSHRMFNEVIQIRRNAKRGIYKENEIEKLMEFVEAVN